MPEAPDAAAARSRAGGARNRFANSAIGFDEPGQSNESSSDEEIPMEQAMAPSAAVSLENNAAMVQQDPSLSANWHADLNSSSHPPLPEHGNASCIGASASSASSLPLEEDYNSADEHEMALRGADSEERERSFEALCAQRGLQIRQMRRDGNCMFRSVADRVYGDADMHDVVRKLCMDYIAKERDYFSPYITQDFESYVRRKRRDGVYGNHVELQASELTLEAVSELFSRPIEVYAYSASPISTFQAGNETAGAAGAAGTTAQAAAAEPLRLSYHGRNHYNVLFDPTRADVGVGLGLPGLEPGGADAEQVERAARESEQVPPRICCLSAATVGCMDPYVYQRTIGMIKSTSAAMEALDQELLRVAADDSDAAATTAAIEAEVMRASYQEVIDARQQPQQTGAPKLELHPVARKTLHSMGHGFRSRSQIEQMVSMGFLRERAEEAATVFDGDLPSMIEYLTDNC